MTTIVLIARPGQLDPALTEALRNAWGGGVLRWLAPDTAAEFDTDNVPGNYHEVWTDLQAQGVDLNALPQDNREKRVLLADMDSTMIGQECIDELAEDAGVGDAVRAVTARAMNGELDFNTALTERVAQLRGLPVSVIDRVFDARITFTSGGDVLLATMKARGGYAALVSGGFTAFTEKVAARLGFDEHRANGLIAQDGHLVGDVTRPILGRDAKVSALEDITARLGLTARDVLAVGDGANDLGMLDRAGLGVALHAKPAVQDKCPVRINHGDLTALLYLQGICVDQFQQP
ncbi:MAG: phosphoserine phosphatase SerB [Paracoccaceae bacterium]